MIFNSEVIDRFAELLRDVLNKGNASEDRIRYSLFTAICEKGSIGNNEIKIEFPHPKIQRAKLDGFVLPSEKHGACAWELKYDRATPGGTNQPKSNKAGALVNDFFRLAALDDAYAVERVVIYLTDPEMSLYFRNPHNGFDVLFNLIPGARFRIDSKLLESRTKSVRDKVIVPIVPCYAVGKFAIALPRNHQLRLYEVQLK